MKESFKEIDIPGYAISNYGRFKNIATERILRPTLSGSGYYIYQPHTSKNIKCNRTVHYLVTRYFIGKRPSGYEVNHKDGNKKNNKFTNLEYVTRKENLRHSIDMGFKKYKLSAKSVKRIRELKKMGLTNNELVEMFGVKKSQISKIVNLKAWNPAIYTKLFN